MPQEKDSFYDNKMRSKPGMKKRPCNRCRRTFWSVGVFNRRCPHCEHAIAGLGKKAEVATSGCLHRVASMREGW